MDREGIDVQVVYPNIMAMASLLDDGELAAAMCRAYNDYAWEKSRNANGRIRPIATVALQQPQEAAKELRRAIKELGCAGTVVPGIVGQRNLDDPTSRHFFAKPMSLEPPSGCTGSRVVSTVPVRSSLRTRIFTFTWWGCRSI